MMGIFFFGTGLMNVKTMHEARRPALDTRAARRHCYI